MRFSSRESLSWCVRGLATLATICVAVCVLRSVRDPEWSPVDPVQTDTLRAVSIETRPSELKPRFTVFYFGDSLSMSEDHPRTVLNAAPMLLRAELERSMTGPEAGKADDLSVRPFVHSGLSVWTLYYVADAIVGLRPDYVVIEFNLYNFSRFWQSRDRKILAAMLPIDRFPEFLSMPTAGTGLTLDELLFSKLVLRSGALPLWQAVQKEQTRAASSFWPYGDRVQQAVAGTNLEFRALSYFETMKRTLDPGTNRSTEQYARTLFGNALTGVGSDAPALRMLSRSLERFAESGMRVLVYVPPYNVDHLTALGLLRDGRLAGTIETVRRVSEQHGARFLDAHALLEDRYFRDAMDHLREAEPDNGHRVLAKRIAAEMDEDWRRLTAAGR